MKVKTAFLSKMFQQRLPSKWPKFHEVALFSAIKRRSVGEKANYVFGNGTEHIFEY